MIFHIASRVASGRVRALALPAVADNLQTSTIPASPTTQHRRPRDRHARKLVPYLITSLLAGRSPDLIAGEWEIVWVSVDDAVDALAAAATTPETSGQIFNIGLGTPLIAKILGLARFVATNARRCTDGRPNDAADALRWWLGTFWQNKEGHR